jgi:hypothetical protein
MTRVNTYERAGRLEAPEVPIAQPEKFSIEDTAKGKNPVQDGSGIELEPVVSKAALDEEYFYRMPIEVHLHDPADESEAAFAEVRVNGELRTMLRGETYTIPRSHVAVLAQAKAQRMMQKKIVNPDGSMGYEERMVTRLAYPFSVVHDPAGAKGADWLRQLLKAPV